MAGEIEPKERECRVPSADGEPEDTTPVTVIERRSGWRALDLRDVWRCRELLFFLAWRDVKVKYKQTVFGAAWAVLQPVVYMAIFTVFFGLLVGLGDRTGDIPYPVFVLSGLLPWTLFANALVGSGNSIVSGSQLITKVYFPRLIIPLAAVGATLLDYLVAMTVLVGMMIWYGIVPGPQVLLLPVLVFLIVLASLAVGIMVSALSTAYRDFAYLVPFGVQVLMYLTPIIYPLSIVPERFRWLLALNPMSGLIEGFRWCLLGQPASPYNVAVGAFIAIMGFLVSVLYFRRVESSFADII
jgi:lipopolysaccharide transport system permease protein